jgi:hypothetical protein
MRRMRLQRGSGRIAATSAVDLTAYDRKWDIRLFWPRLTSNGSTWSCRYEIDGSHRHVYGESSLTALNGTLLILSTSLYYCDQGRVGKLGFAGEVGGYLGVPQTCSDRAGRSFFVRDDRVRALVRAGVVANERRRGQPMAEESYPVAWSPENMPVRLYTPRWRARDNSWAAAFEVGAPVGLRGEGRGDTSLQALYAAHLALVDQIRRSGPYRAGRVGWGCRPKKYLFLTPVIEPDAAAD